MPKGCCVAGCTANSVKNKGLKFHVVPLSGPRREEWLKAIGRCDVSPDGIVNLEKLWEPKSNYTYVCGRHFITGEKSNDQTEPDYIPSIFPTMSNSKIKFRMSNFNDNDNTNEPAERKENQLWENPTEENFPTLKQEDDEDSQVQEVLIVKVKEEEAEIVVTLEEEEDTAVAMKTSHLDDHNYFMDPDSMKEEVQDWMIPLNHNVEAEYSRETWSEDSNTERTHVERELRIFPRRSKRQRKVFPKGKNIVCLICKMRFKQTSELKQHMDVHSCPFCRKVFFKDRSLKHHMMLHTGELPFPCALCGKAFRTKGSVNYHIKMVHSLLKPFSCSFCQMAFKSDLHLKKHMYQHTGRRVYECSFCDKHFKLKYQLEHHKLQHKVSKKKTRTFKTFSLKMI